MYRLILPIILSAAAVQGEVAKRQWYLLIVHTHRHMIATILKMP